MPRSSSSRPSEKCPSAPMPVDALAPRPTRHRRRHGDAGGALCGSRRRGAEPSRDARTRALAAAVRSTATAVDGDGAGKPYALRHPPGGRVSADCVDRRCARAMPARVAAVAAAAADGGVAGAGGCHGRSRGNSWAGSRSAGVSMRRMSRSRRRSSRSWRRCDGCRDGAGAAHRIAGDRLCGRGTRNGRRRDAAARGCGDPAGVVPTVADEARAVEEAVPEVRCRSSDRSSRRRPSGVDARRSRMAEPSSGSRRKWPPAIEQPSRGRVGEADARTGRARSRRSSRGSDRSSRRAGGSTTPTRMRKPTRTRGRGARRAASADVLATIAPVAPASRTAEPRAARFRRIPWPTSATTSTRRCCRSFSRRRRSSIRRRASGCARGDARRATTLGRASCGEPSIPSRAARAWPERCDWASSCI